MERRVKLFNIYGRKNRKKQSFNESGDLKEIGNKQNQEN